MLRKEEQLPEVLKVVLWRSSEHFDGRVTLTGNGAPAFVTDTQSLAVWDGMDWVSDRRSLDFLSR